jgi:hypothetical protein
MIDSNFLGFRTPNLNPNGDFTEENGAPGAIPTRDLPLRRRTLYATELREPE